MLSAINNITIDFKNQVLKGNSFKYYPELHTSEYRIEYKRDTNTIKCPFCGGKVEIYESYETRLRDMPIEPGTRNYVIVSYHRYRCTHCGETFTENIDTIKHPKTRITHRLAAWIKLLLLEKSSISAVNRITGVHWGTIKKIHLEIMEEALLKRELELKERNYKPKFLAIDEFALHKGHKYATCVMDLEEGDVIWVGKGRSMKDFSKFFKEIDMEYLSEVKAIAMDMNASYHILVERNMPQVDIVYDRYHMQAQYGKEVLGVVRLDEARKHKQTADTIKEIVLTEEDINKRREMKQEAKEESKLYSTLKRSRWSLLMNSKNLDEERKEKLEEILNDHKDLAVCYAMKEELCELYDIRDIDESINRWQKWFEAAKGSNVPALIKFAVLKERRLPGLIAHAVYPISTGKLEGLNNKIKVAKRIAYGYRDTDYFFTLIKYNTIPWVKHHN